LRVYNNDSLIENLAIEAPKSALFVKSAISLQSFCIGFQEK